MCIDVYYKAVMRDWWDDDGWSEKKCPKRRKILWEVKNRRIFAVRF